MAGFTNLTREDAARILFGDQLDADDFDGHETPFQSGADVAEALASWFGFTAEDYERIAAARRGAMCACGRELHADGTCADGGAFCG